MGIAALPLAVGALRPRPNARATAGARQSTDAIVELLDSFAQRVERATRGVHSAAHRRSLIAREAARLRRDVDRLITSTRAGVSRAGAMQGALEQLGPVGWHRRVTEYVRAAIADVSRTATAAAREQLPPRARQAAFRQQVARSLDYRLRRIAVSEVFNANIENELSRMAADPAIAAVRWTPTRSAPCPRCVALARSDLYGLGPGIFPLGNVPLPPHPFCRCRRIAVEGLVTPRRARRQPPAAVLAARLEAVDGLTPEQMTRVRRDLQHHLARSSRHPATRRLRRAIRAAAGTPSGTASGAVA